MFLSAVSKRLLLCAFGFLALAVLTYLLRPLGLPFFGLNLKLYDLGLYDIRWIAAVSGSLPSFSVVVFFSLFEMGVICQRSLLNRTGIQSHSFMRPFAIVSKWLLFFVVLEFLQLTDWSSWLYLSGRFDPLDIVSAFVGAFFSMFVLRRVFACPEPTVGESLAKKAKAFHSSEKGVDGTLLRSLLRKRWLFAVSLLQTTLFGIGLFSSLATSPNKPVSAGRCSKVIASRDGLVTWKEPQPLVNAGKILLSGNKLFVSDFGRGAHVFDNSNPSEPKALGYLSIPHNEDLALKDGVLYASVGSELAVIDLRNLPEVKVLDLQSNVFDCSPQGSATAAQGPNQNIRVSGQINTAVQENPTANAAPKPSSAARDSLVTCSFSSALDACLVLFETSLGTLLRSCRTPETAVSQEGETPSATKAQSVGNKCEIKAMAEDKVVKSVHLCSESQEFALPEQNLTISDSKRVLGFSREACSLDQDYTLTLLKFLDSYKLLQEEADFVANHKTVQSLIKQAQIKRSDNPVTAGNTAENTSENEAKK